MTVLTIISRMFGVKIDLEFHSVKPNSLFMSMDTIDMTGFEVVIRNFPLNLNIYSNIYREKLLFVHFLKVIGVIKIRFEIYFCFCFVFFFTFLY